MRACIQALSSIFRTNLEYIEEKYGETRMSPFLQRVIANLFGSYELAPGICNAAMKNDFAELKPLLEQLIEPGNSVFVEAHSICRWIVNPNLHQATNPTGQS